MDCSPPGFSVPGILQARTLEWVAIPFARGCSWPRDQTCVSCIGRQTLYHRATRKLVFLYICCFPRIDVLRCLFLRVCSHTEEAFLIYRALCAAPCSRRTKSATDMRPRADPPSGVCHADCGGPQSCWLPYTELPAPFLLPSSLPNCFCWCWFPAAIN